jgi:myo-inositol-1(or 4)-monophosphatase
MIRAAVPIILVLLLVPLLRIRSCVSAFVVHRISRANCCSRAQAISLSFATTRILDLEAWKHELSTADLNGLLETAEEAARAAGSIITSNTGCCAEVSTTEYEIKYSVKDIVTVYDKQAQLAVQDVIRSMYPTHRFLGEEDVAAGAAASEAALLQALQEPAPSEFVWICDPIDGTANFASGLTLSAVTIGVVYKGTPVVGVIYDPHRDEMFSAVNCQGAYLNGKQRLRVTQAVTDVKDAIINAGCPADPSAFACSMRGVLALNGQSRGLRMIACSALTTAWIAAGRLTAHFGYDLSSWDLMAGALLIQEAGGLVTDLDGSPYKLQTRNMLCSNGLVHDQIMIILREADAVSFTRSQ